MAKLPLPEGAPGAGVPDALLVEGLGLYVPGRVGAAGMVKSGALEEEELGESLLGLTGPVAGDAAGPGLPPLSIITTTSSTTTAAATPNINRFRPATSRQSPRGSSPMRMAVA